jgi:hypothetical protein
MDTQQERKLDQVRKLLELANSDNVHEASNAAAQAQRLMSKFQITEAMIEVEADEDEREDLEVDTLHSHDARNLPTWKGQLGVAMCEVNACHCYRTGSELRIIGRPSDANSVRYLFSYVVREIDRLTAIEARLRGNPGRTWCNNFRLGAVHEVNRRLREAHAEARAAMKREANDGDTLGNGAALVRVNDALAKLDARRDEAVLYGKKRLHLRARSGSRSRYDAGARNAGRRAGASINLNAGGRAPLGAGARGALKTGS